MYRGWILALRLGNQSAATGDTLSGYLLRYLPRRLSLSTLFDVGHTQDTNSSRYKACVNHHHQLRALPKIRLQTSSACYPSWIVLRHSSCRSDWLEPRPSAGVELGMASLLVPVKSCHTCVIHSPDCAQDPRPKIVGPERVSYRTTTKTCLLCDSSKDRKASPTIKVVSNRPCNQQAPRAISGYSITHHKPEATLPG